MDGFIRARTESQFNIRRDMILDACDEIYSRDGLMGVTFNTVAAKTTFTRPALYNYYKNREEMIFDLMVRETDKWAKQIREVFEGDGPLTKEEFCSKVSEVAMDNIKLIRLLSESYLFEKDCPIEKVNEYRNEHYKDFEFIGKCLYRVFPDATEEEIEQFQKLHGVVLFGLYAYTNRVVTDAVGPYFSNGIPQLNQALYECLMAGLRIFEKK